ncbi:MULTISPECIES: ABC transporter permease [Amycolatopsis]|uniref:Peptide/nickel transport system permease protein n=3 Tax=Amycolatopsis TaxID=1813 RepID=A0A841BG69_9PSEU|nr:MULTISPECIES: ABC transporter permease [Amycolatopsis]MBB5857775.1 peptide/nickel transport system permease protein [Amycolatopsis umgeniensis]OXM45837.1 ABC transporter permease [Amycolatopsis alba DSM 44262]GHH02698.1 peptide ABC transporter permease [Amycolatopsis oliviviridis]
MTGLLLRRLRDLVIILVIVGTMMFFVIRLIPGDPAQAILGPTARPSDVDALRESMGLNGPLWEQYLSWAGNVLHGDFGTSITYHAPVLGVVADHILPTLTLAVLSTVISFFLSVAITSWQAVSPRNPVARALDRLSALGMAMPDFWISLMLVLVFSVTLRWFPSSGYENLFTDPATAVPALVLPLTVLVIGQTALFVLTLRESLLGELPLAYLRTARVKGLSERQVMTKHVLPNALMPLITQLGSNFAMLVGGIVIIESIFVVPGLGHLLMGAVSTRDFPLIQGVTLFVAVLFVLVNLLVDLSYALLDPKVRVS